MTLRLSVIVFVALVVGCTRESARATLGSPMPVDLIKQLPDLEGFRRAAQSLAVLDAILSPDWEYRYYSFDAAWSDGEMMASMRDDQGDHWFALLTDAGTVLHGLAHESDSFHSGRPKPWVFADLPELFQESFLREPAFDTSNSTYCIWRQPGDAAWSHGVKPAGLDDGHAQHLSVLVGGPSAYVAWARDYYEVELARDDVAAVLDHKPITPELARRMNPDVDIEALQAELRRIGYR